MPMDATVPTDAYVPPWAQDTVPAFDQGLILPGAKDVADGYFAGFCPCVCLVSRAIHKGDCSGVSQVIEGVGLERTL
mgnify:FL=1|jgi:hypothetical protein